MSSRKTESAVLSDDAVMAHQAAVLGGARSLDALQRMSAADRSETVRRQRGREPWSERNIRQPYESPAITLALADPPYPNQSERHYGDHQDYAGEVDHAQLLERLSDEYDGWALCTGAYMLLDVAALCPKGTRVVIWRKPSASYKPGVSISFQYEPVLLFGGRRRHRHATIVSDIFDAPVVYGEVNGIRRGIKSYEFCAAVFERLGARPEDSMDDVFPGSGAVGQAWTRWCNEPQLPIFTPASQDQMEIAA